jgi:TolB-like protein
MFVAYIDFKQYCEKISEGYFLRVTYVMEGSVRANGVLMEAGLVMRLRKGLIILSSYPRLAASLFQSLKLVSHP